ncbi:MAG: hypothetical protein KKC79_20030 [Gammaproteobacteria bacterium]|nr:hypothetical protein [Gammaproteobacteria bacterium]MBU1440336.1 hypothetical protein [Gammaproteobacteria bacterium]MBU2288638.1 hypothetical protein [Gammaproteobacteria bacterium]MBU2410925.1 hypothetical protein [Gammaproteobacteria bacterium]
MQKALVLLAGPLASASLIFMFGWSALLASFGLALMTLVFSTQGRATPEDGDLSTTMLAGL